MTAIRSAFSAANLHQKQNLAKPKEKLSFKDLDREQFNVLRANDDFRTLYEVAPELIDEHTQGLDANQFRGLMTNIAKATEPIRKTYPNSTALPKLVADNLPIKPSPVAKHASTRDAFLDRNGQLKQRRPGVNEGLSQDILESRYGYVNRVVPSRTQKNLRVQTFNDIKNELLTGEIVDHLSHTTAITPVQSDEDRKKAALKQLIIG